MNDIPLDKSVIFVEMENEQQNQYPPKPEAGKGVVGAGSSIISLGLFAVLFFFITGGSIDAIIAVLIILLIHELGHLTAMKVFKYFDRDIFFLPMPGSLMGDRSTRISQTKKVITLLAGPLPGIVIGLALLGYGFSIDHKVLQFVGEIFLLINMFNLLPFDPLDGGKLVGTLFYTNQEWIKLVFLFISLVGFLVASYYAPMMGIMALFVGLRINSIYRKRKVRTQLVEELNIDLNKTYDEVSDKDYWEIRRYFLKQIPNNPIDPDRFEPFANESLLINQVKSVILNPVNDDMSFGMKLVTFLVWLAGLIVPVWFVLTHMDYFTA